MRTVNATPVFPSLVADERTRHIADHRKSMRLCWPDWDGNLSVGAQIECHACIATRADDGSPLYAYTAPCKIVEVVDENTFIVEIDYPPDVLAHAAWLSIYNGVRLRLDICDVWVPVRLLIAQRERSSDE